VRAVFHAFNVAQTKKSNKEIVFAMHPARLYHDRQAYLEGLQRYERFG